MHRRGRIYWLTWALLVLGAAATGVASVQDAFFRGAVAAFVAALALPLYERAGPRAAAFLGLATGILWQLFLAYGYGRLVWSDELRAYAMSRLEIDLSVSAAAFAGAALTAAMVHRDQRFGRAALMGGTLALAMTALPYGFIRSSEAARMGPVEVTWLMPLEDIGEDGRPVRPKGVNAPTLSAEDRAALREAFLVIDVAGETALVDTEGRRLWAVWRKRLHQPGHEDGPVRRVFIAWREPVNERTARHTPLGSLTLALPGSPDGSCVIEQGISSTKVVAGDAHVLEDGTLPFSTEHPSWFSRITGTWFGEDTEENRRQLAPVFLLIRNLYPFKAEIGEEDKPWRCWEALRSMSTCVDGPGPSPMIWVVRREPLETAHEACDRPIPPSDRSYLRNYGESWLSRHRFKTKTQTIRLPDVPGPIKPETDNPAEKAADRKLPELPKDPAPAAK